MPTTEQQRRVGRLKQQIVYKDETIADLRSKLEETNECLQEVSDLGITWRRGLRELYSVLQELEWLGMNGCFYCGQDKTRGHKDNCLVGNVLAKHEENDGD